MARRLILIILCVGIVGSNIILCFADDKLREIDNKVQFLTQDLNLTPEQADKIHDILAEAQQKNVRGQNQPHRPHPNISEEKIYQETNTKISAVLTIEQRDKFRDFSKLNPQLKRNLLELKQRLSLNEAQTESIKIIMASKTSEMEMIKSSSESKDPGQYHQHMKKIMDAQAELIEKLLTKAQKKEFRRLKKEHEKKIREQRSQR